MKQSLKLFNFQGTPVFLSVWFFLLFVVFSVEITIGIFISVLLHEMAHTWMAHRKGYYVHAITVDLLSGGAAIDSNMHDRDSIPITAAGPFMTLALTVLSFVTYLFSAITFFKLLFIINLYLFIFNILPIYPMDGGQIVRSYANLSRNRYTARRNASMISLIFSVAVLLYGLTSFNILMTLFGGYFAYLALKELNYIK